MTLSAFRQKAGRWLQGQAQRTSSRLRSLRVEPGAWWSDRTSRSRFVLLDEPQLRGLVRSATCFILGSGKSLDEIAAPEWQEISLHNTIAFNYFIRARFVRVDFHLVGEMACPDDLAPRVWRPVVEEYARLIEENPFYSETVLGLQEGLRAVQSNRLVSSPTLHSGRRVFRYRRIARGERCPPTTSLSSGLVHGAGTLVDCVNLAVVLGFREIVLAGVDLYDRRVFSSTEAASPAGRPDAVENRRHATADAMVDYLGYWAPLLAARGVTLSVYNPRSLLSRVLPVKARLG